MMMKNTWGPNDIAVRPVLDRAERDRWDEREHHYLEFRGGEAVRHVAPNGVALLGAGLAAAGARPLDRLDTRAARSPVASCGEHAC